VQKELEGRSQTVDVACTKMYLVQIWSHTCFVPHVHPHTSESRLCLYTAYLLLGFIQYSFSSTFRVLLHHSFKCLYCKYLCLWPPPPPSGTGSFMNSEEFCFLLLLLHRFLGFLGSGLLSPLAVGWYFEEYRAMVTFLD